MRPKKSPLQRLLFRLDAMTSFSTLTMMRSRLREYAETRAARRGGAAMPAWAQHLVLCVVMPPLFAAWFARRWLRLLLGLAGACRRTVALVTQIALAGRVGSLAYVAALVAFHYFDETTDAMVIWSWIAELRGGEQRYLVFVVLGCVAFALPATLTLVVLGGALNGENRLDDDLVFSIISETEMLCETSEELEALATAPSVEVVEAVGTGLVNVLRVEQPHPYPPRWIAMPKMELLKLIEAHESVLMTFLQALIFVFEWRRGTPPAEVLTRSWLNTGGFVLSFFSVGYAVGTYRSQGEATDPNDSNRTLRLFTFTVLAGTETIFRLASVVLWYENLAIGVGLNFFGGFAIAAVLDVWSAINFAEINGLRDCLSEMPGWAQRSAACIVITFLLPLNEAHYITTLWSEVEGFLFFATRTRKKYTKFPWAAFFATSSFWYATAWPATIGMGAILVGGSDVPAAPTACFFAILGAIYVSAGSGVLTVSLPPFGGLLVDPPTAAPGPAVNRADLRGDALTFVVLPERSGSATWSLALASGATVATGAVELAAHKERRVVATVQVDDAEVALALLLMTDTGARSRAKVARH